MSNTHRLLTPPLLALTGGLAVLALPSVEAQLAAGVASLFVAGASWQLNRKYKAQAHLMCDAINLTGLGAMLLSAEGKIIRVNDQFIRISGYSENDAVHRPMLDFIAPRYGFELEETIWTTLASKGEWEGEIWSLHQQGYEYAERRRIRILKNIFGRIEGYVVVMADIHPVETHDMYLSLQRHNDNLTGLPNRQRIHDLLAFQLFRQAGGGDNTPALDIAIIDIDSFQMINNNLGYGQGDQLLIAFANRLSDYDEASIVGRLGGDVFIMMKESRPGQLVSHQEWVEGLHTSLMEPIPINGESLRLSVSIGSYRTSQATPAEFDAANIMQGVELALNRAKGSGTNTWRVYDTALDAIDTLDMTLIQALRGALLADDQLEIYYQTQHDTQTGNLIGYEALLRWNHPDLGMISPADFIPLAERHGIIEHLGRWVIQAAVTQLAEWRDNGLPLQVIWVNISAIQLQLETLETIINSALSQYSIPAQWLGLELTESIFLDDRSQTVIDSLQALKNNGHSIAIDDFGTGHSSLSYLRNLPVDKVKLDRSFIKSVPKDMANVTIIRSVLAIAKNMGLEVVAEGVETPEQRDFLMKEGCHAIQGYLYSKPTPIASLIAA